jgi:hypothetical protein
MPHQTPAGCGEAFSGECFAGDDPDPDADAE